MTFDLLLPKDVARFHSKYECLTGDQCWLWRGETQGAGYGVLAIWRNNQRAARFLAHRLAVHLDGRDVAGLVVRHDCDTPRCVNPNHLQTGTQADNVRDAVERGRLNLSGLELGRHIKPKRPPRYCSEPGCGHRYKARGWCDKHWQYHKSIGTFVPDPNHPRRNQRKQTAA